MTCTHTPYEVVRLASEGRLEEWVHGFLNSVGKNVGLSDGLRLQPRYWIGPLVLPLERLERCCGPESSMEYVMNEERWDAYTGRMAESLAKGWAPPPVIAQYGDGHFVLRDGNHRHEGLRRAGKKSYWCLIWCDSEEGRQEAVRLLTEAE